MTGRHGVWMAIAIIAMVFAIDRITKFFFLSYAMTTATHVIAITTHRNYGLIANLPVPSWIIIALTVLVLAVIGWKLVEQMLIDPLSHTVFSLSLIAGGALGNLYDRCTMGFVFDWIWIFQRSVINLADLAIGVGMLWYLISRIDRFKKQ